MPATVIAKVTAENSTRPLLLPVKELGKVGQMDLMRNYHVIFALVSASPKKYSKQDPDVIQRGLVFFNDYHEHLFTDTRRQCKTRNSSFC